MGGLESCGGAAAVVGVFMLLWWLFIGGPGLAAGARGDAQAAAIEAKQGGK